MFAAMHSLIAGISFLASMRVVSHYSLSLWWSHPNIVKRLIPQTYLPCARRSGDSLSATLESTVLLHAFPWKQNFLHICAHPGDDFILETQWEQKDASFFGPWSTRQPSGDRFLLFLPRLRIGCMDLFEASSLLFNSYAKLSFF
jgi:hypothetical protein